jgi:hypothetical protein
LKSSVNDLKDDHDRKAKYELEVNGMNLLAVDASPKYDQGLFQTEQSH